MNTWSDFSQHARYHDPAQVLRDAQQQSAQTVNKPRVVGNLGRAYAREQSPQEPIANYADRRGVGP
jgi:hypothetical protein